MLWVLFAFGIDCLGTLLWARELSSRDLLSRRLFTVRAWVLGTVLMHAFAFVVLPAPDFTAALATPLKSVSHMQACLLYHATIVLCSLPFLLK